MAQKKEWAVGDPWVASGPNHKWLWTPPMGGLQAMMTNLSTEKTPCPAISWYLEGAQLNVRHVTKKCASKTVVSCIDKSQHLDSTFKSFSITTTISIGKISIFILTD